MTAAGPANWEYPFGTSDMHVALAIYSKDDKSLEEVLEQARQSRRDLPKISVVYRMKFSELPGGRNPFGFKDGLLHVLLHQLLPFSKNQIRQDWLSYGRNQYDLKDRPLSDNR
jgi:hypothetical protein